MNFILKIAFSFLLVFIFSINPFRARALNDYVINEVTESISEVQSWFPIQDGSDSTIDFTTQKSLYQSLVALFHFPITRNKLHFTAYNLVNGPPIS